MSAHGDCDIDHVLKLSTNPNKVEGTLHIEPVESVKGITPDALTAFLAGNNVRAQFIDEGAIEALCEMVKEAPLEIHSKIIAIGTPAINGKSAAYTLEPNLQQQFEEIEKRKDSFKDGTHESPPESDSDDDGETINFYDQMAFVVVEKGNLIATKTERSVGADGSDIFGQTIAASEGKPNDGLLDDSIIVHPDGKCIANKAGLLRVQPEVMFITDELEIRDDVDFQTGRIRFPGSVEVRGSVRDKFCVRAGGDVLIRGLVEAADLESKQNITLSRGMAGKETGTIKAGVDFNAGYLEGVIGEVGQNLIIKSEITNSVLSVGGTLKAEHAALRGGRLMASKGASIGSIGSIQNVETELVIGSLPEIENEIRAIDGFFERLESEIKSQTSKLETFAAVIAKATASQIEEQMGMQFEIDELSMRMKQLETAKKQLLHIFLENTSTKLKVQKAIFLKVVLYIPGYKVEFNNELTGESLIELGPTGHPSITYRGKTVDLKEHARVIPNERVLRVIETEGTLSVAA